MEFLITTPLEADMLSGMPWADEIRSESIPGLSSIVIVFKRGTDVLAARQMAQERLVSVHALPNGTAVKLFFGRPLHETVR